MKIRPWPLVLLSLGFFSAPILGLFFSAPEPPLFGFFAFVAAGVAFFTLKEWSYLYLLFFFSWLTYESVVTWAEPLLFVTNVSFFGYLCLPQVRNVFLKNKNRWWETKPRYRLNHMVTLHFDTGTIIGKAKDLSAGGIFVETRQRLPKKDVTLHFSLGDKVWLKGRVVHARRQSAPTNEPPILGFGIEFKDVKDYQLRSLKSIIRALKKKGDRQVARVDLWQNFIEWVVTFLTTGRGLIPPSGTR